MLKKTDIILSIISGLMLVLAFPPFDFFFFAWIALVPLFIALWEKNARTSFLIGILTGLIYFLGTIYWVFHSMYFYGYVAAPLSALILILLCLYLAVYTGVFSVLFSFISGRSRMPALMIVPFLWVTLDVMRTYAPILGFPWSSLGYSQYKFLSLIQIADVTGIYGISFLVAAINSTIFDVIFYWPKKMRKEPLLSRWPLTLSIIILFITVTGVLFYGHTKLTRSSNSRSIKVSIMQGNIPQDKKWDAKFQREVLDTYKRLSLSVSAKSPDLIVWPETAVPFIFGYDNILTQDIISFQKQLGIHLLFGSMLAKDADRLSNSAVLLSPEGNILSTYDKIHLVPYGEYVPLRKLFPFIEKITVGIGDFLPGEEPVVMQAPFAKIGSLICYEIIFPGLVRQFVDRDANVLVTITNDAWFGRTSAPYQHFYMAVFRAIENRVPVVRAANTGISGFIDSKGRITNKSDIFVEDAMTENIAIGNEKSFYTKHGDIFAYFCMVCSTLMVISRLFYGKRKLL
jgi:apolipoprotein N-acyltransferase